LHALLHSQELSRRRRATLAYSAASWLTALPSVTLLIASIAIRYGPLLLVTGLFTGFVWVSMFVGYVEGYRIHSEYIDRTVPRWRLIRNGILGALVDVVAPWYALITRPSMGDFIVKDRPTPEGRSTPEAWPSAPKVRVPVSAAEAN
jgi:hypothetical protein